MANANRVGVFKTPSGVWAYRITYDKDGKRASIRSQKDENGNILLTKRDAIRARQAALVRLSTSKPINIPARKTVKEVFDEYCQKGRGDRAYQTIRTQDSLWDNHMNQRFGSRYVDGVSSAEVIDYLSELYYIENLSYRYVEAFLKMFYLIFGQAYSRNYLNVDTYNKLCVNRDTKIRMPKMKAEDDTEIVSYSPEQLSLLDEYFKDTAAETAYLLGRYCGLRISECYGLKWENVNLSAGTILIDRQMQYQKGIIKLVAPKTRNGKRVLYMNTVLKVHFQKIAQQRAAEEEQQAALRAQNQRMIEDIDGTLIPSTAFVNCLPDGKIQTVNSMKYHSKEIKRRLGIDFKYHHLRHTYGTLLAEMNTPAHLLCNQMGHGNIHVTQRYYIATSKSGINILQTNLNRL